MTLNNDRNTSSFPDETTVEIFFLNFIAEVVMRKFQNSCLPNLQTVSG